MGSGRRLSCGEGEQVWSYISREAEFSGTENLLNGISVADPTTAEEVTRRRLFAAARQPAPTDQPQAYQPYAKET